MTVSFPPVPYLLSKKIGCFVKASIGKVKMNCTFQKQQTVFILFTTESVIFFLTQLNESCVCLPKRMLKRQKKKKKASKLEKRFIGLMWLDFGGRGVAGAGSS